MWIRIKFYSLLYYYENTQEVFNNSNAPNMQSCVCCLHIYSASLKLHITSLRKISFCTRAPSGFQRELNRRLFCADLILVIWWYFWWFDYPINVLPYVSSRDRVFVKTLLFDYFWRFKFTLNAMNVKRVCQHHD